MSSLLLNSPLTKEDATKIISAAKDKAKLSFSHLADNLHVNKVWLVAAFNGEHPIGSELADRLFKTLNITGTAEELVSLSDALSQLPTRRGASNTGTDPAIRRLQELIDVYGQSITTLIREEAGDGIMSAIDCTLNLEKVKVKNGDGQEETRIVITVDGKFLPYKVDHGSK